MITDILAARIVLALSQDIQNEVELPQHFNVVEMRRPPVVTPDLCPLLCVWLMQKALTPLNTNSFQSVVNVGISWQEASETVETMLADPASALRLLAKMDGIEQRIRTLSLNSISTGVGLLLDGEPILQAYDLVPATVDYLPPTAIETGLVEGYAMTVQVAVTEKG